MRYIEYHLDNPFLKHYVDCFWEISFPTENEFTTNEVILPDGGVEWVFNLGDPYERKGNDGAAKSISNSEIIGQRTSPVSVKQKCGTHLFAIRFKPFGINALGFKDHYAIVDSSVEGNIFFRSLESEIFELLYDKKIDALLLQKVEQLILKNAIVNDDVPLMLVEFWKQAVQNRGNIEISAFRNKVNYSKANFHRVFKKYVGITPKKLCSILQFNSMINGMQMFQSYTKVGLAYNYYDQSHMIKKFKLFAGMTPSQFFSENFFLYKTLETIEKNRFQGLIND